MLNQKRNVLTHQFALEHLLSEPHDTIQVITVASILEDVKTSGDLSPRLYEQLKHEFKNMFKSEDLSKLFGTAYILAKNDDTFMEGQLVARLITLLAESEITTGGPYAEKNGEVNLISNIFIALFLQLHEVELLNLNAYVWSQLENDLFLKNYSNRATILYFASKLNKPNNILLKKLAKNVYIVEPEHSVLLNYLQRKIDKNYKPFFENNPLFKNADIITTAVVVADYFIENSKDSTSVPRFQNYSDQVYKIVDQESRHYAEPLKKYLLNIEAKVTKVDRNNEISLLPHCFVEALHHTDVSLENKQLSVLGAANVFCWVAYTLYDDFLDDEGRIEYLSVANSAMRKSLTLLLDVFKSTQQHSLINFLFDCMDQANAWELENTRFKVTRSKIIIDKLPDYGDLSVLSNRAAGHVIAPLCIAKQYGFTHEQQQHIRQGLHHYLVARQLNDDLHDWSEDIKNGHCTYVLSCMLRGAKITPGEYSHAELRELLKSYFWKQGFKELSHKALMHVDLSRSSFAKTNKFNLDARFFEFLSSIESSVREAQFRFAQKQQFLKEFKQSV